MEAFQALLAAFKLGVWGWGALAIVASILLGLLIGSVIGSSLGSDVKTDGTIERLPKNCAEAKEIREKLQKDKESALGVLARIKKQRDTAWAVFISTMIAASAAVAASIITAGIPIVGFILLGVAVLATSTASAAGVVVSKLDELSSRVREYLKFLDSLLKLAESAVKTLCS